MARRSVVRKMCRRERRMTVCFERPEGAEVRIGRLQGGRSAGVAKGS